MALGSPSITTPNALDLRAIQAAISNARQRIEGIEASITQASGTVSAAGNASATNINTLRNQLAALQTEVDALEAAIGSITTVDDASLVLAQRTFISREAAGSASTPVNDAGLVLAQRTFTPKESSTVNNTYPVVVDDANLVLAQKTFISREAPTVNNTYSTSVDDSNLVIAMQSLQRHQALAPVQTGSISILETQIFGA